MHYTRSAAALILTKTWYCCTLLPTVRKTMNSASRFIHSNCAQSLLKMCALRWTMRASNGASWLFPHVTQADSSMRCRMPIRWSSPLQTRPIPRLVVATRSTLLISPRRISMRHCATVIRLRRPSSLPDALSRRAKDKRAWNRPIPKWPWDKPCRSSCPTWQINGPRLLMKNNRIGACTLALVLALSCFCLTAGAEDWTPLSRSKALEQTRSTQLEKRRIAYGRLAEVGTMEDIPLLLTALWDDQALIRGIAEQSVWGIWLRTDDPVVDPLFQTGMLLITEDKVNAAIEKLNQVIELKPDFAEAWNRRGNAYAALGDESRALADYEHAIALNPYQFGTMESCAEIWLMRSDYRKAAEYFRRALDLNPNLADAAEALHELEEKLENDRI